jgi:hypothetical protein
VSPGRPRNPAIDAAVLSAAVEVLAERGYTGFALPRPRTHLTSTKAVGKSLLHHDARREPFALASRFRSDSTRA